MTRDYERITDVVAQLFGVNTNEISPDTHLARVPGSDDLDRMELFYELEEEFCINRHCKRSRTHCSLCTA